MPQKNNYKPDKNRCITQPFIIVGCLIKKNNKFLFVKENGKYNLPQGWLELEEKLEDGAKREAEEETGLKIEILNFRGNYTFIKKTPSKILHKIKIIFNAKPTGKTLENQNSLPCTWFSLSEIKSGKVKLWDNDIINIINNKSAHSAFIDKIIKRH